MKPSLCSECSKFIEESNLEWVECGGMNVGMTHYPKVWRLRDKNETNKIKETTKYLQKVAHATRLLSKVREFVSPGLQTEIDKFFEK